MNFRREREIGMNGVEAKNIQTEMTNGDYEHLVETFDKYFGDYVILER